jgi:hypothetical protein
MNAGFEYHFLILFKALSQVCMISFVIVFLTLRVIIISGPIVTNLGWKWLFHILIIFEGVQFVLMFFLCPETTYHREREYNIDQTLDQDLEKLAEREREMSQHQNEPEVSGAHIPAKKTFYETLKPWSGIQSNENIIKLIIAPFVTVFNIGALYAIAANGIIISWYVTVSYILAQEFSPPPYLFTAAKVGYLSTGPFIGGVIGSLLMGAITDPLIRYCSKKNHGI